VISQRDLSTPCVPPATELEKAVAQIWEDAIGVRPIGIDDDFFELGGDSLRALQVASRICGQFGVDLMDTMPFSQPTVRELARAVEEQLLARLDSLSDEEVQRLLESGSEGGPSTPFH